MTPREIKDEAAKGIEQRFAALHRDLRILKWQMVALLVLTYVLVFLTFCGDG